MKERRKMRRLSALGVWAAGFVLVVLQLVLSTASIRHEVEGRLIGDAGHAAALAAGLLALPAWDGDEPGMHTVVMSLMEDERIYGIMVQTRQGFFDGIRRNHLWEPVPWDDEITEHAVQGMSQLSMEGQVIGKVEVYLSRRSAEAEVAQGVRHVRLQACLWLVYLSGALLLLLWYWGDTQRLYVWLAACWQRLRDRRREAAPGPAPNLRRYASLVRRFADSAQTLAGRPAVAVPPQEERPPAIDEARGRAHLQAHPDAWLVTAGLFRQTFERGPLVLTRLFEDNELTGLRHLGRMLEKAAPCLGADRLGAAARDMGEALRDSGSAARAMSVERCAVALREVLEALGSRQSGK